MQLHWFSWPYATPHSPARSRSSRLVDLGHPGPADRFLAATAIVYELTLVTADERLLASKRVRTLANR